MFDKEIDRKENLFPIGEAAKKGNVSRRTLRYYEKMNLIEPDFVDINGYRYYSNETILKIPIIKYLKVMDFTLDDIKKQLTSPDYCIMIKSFDLLLNRCKVDIDEIYNRQEIIKDWKKLLEEACIVLSMKLDDVSIKYLDRKALIKYPITFNYDYPGTILDLGFANFVEAQFNKISGPVMFYFPSINDRIKKEQSGTPVEGLYVQKALKKIEDEHLFYMPAGMYASKYHVGSHKNLVDTYNELLEWEKDSEYKIKGPVFERFVVDCWSTYEESKYVTELIVPIIKREEKR